MGVIRSVKFNIPGFNQLVVLIFRREKFNQVEFQNKKAIH